jgi:tRNA A-37 threonylcarbamoyl transferase component Bud32
MSTESSLPVCPRCGASLSRGSVEGLCAKCLGALNFATETVEPGEPPVQAAAPMRAEELAPHFPQLEILDCLGRGGMGVVYKTRQKSLNRLVALKLLAPERVTDAKFAERFTREAQALAALNHPNIVTVHDFGQAGGFYFLLMEFVDGVNLRQAMKARRFTPEQALAIVPPVCEALQFAHEHGIVHRDIKPENLLLDKDGRVKIADFGIAKMLGSDSSGGLAESQPVGTPQYMAPEQKDRGRTDHRADIYSLGVVLYEMLTGERPRDRIEPPSKRVQVDVRIDEIVLRALEKSPELRFATAAEFRTQVEMAVAGPSISGPGSNAESKSRFKKCALLEGLGIAAIVALWAWCWRHRTNTDFVLVTEGSLFMLLGLMMYSSSIPALLRMLPMNSLFGFRILEAFESEKRWYDINAQSGRYMTVWCWLIIAVGAAMFFVIPHHIFKNFILIIGTVSLGFFLSWSWARETSSRVPKPRLALLVIYECVFGFLFASLFVIYFVAAPCRVNTGEFSPGLRRGSNYALWKSGRVSVGDVIAYERDGGYVLGHVAGVGGSRLTVHRKGQPAETVQWSRVFGRFSRALVHRAASSSSALTADTNPAIPAPGPLAEPTGRTFGPETEHVLPSSEPGRGQEFQFKDGRIFVVGHGPGTTKEEYEKDRKQMEEAGGGDFNMTVTDSGLLITGEGCIFTGHMSDLKLDTATADEVAQRMRTALAYGGSLRIQTKDLPRIYLFKTWAGDIGIMEILGLVEDKTAGAKVQGMNFRYKLVQGLDAGAAARLAASLANFEASREFDVAPFEASQGAPVFSDSRWQWQATAGYGRGDLQAVVSFTKAGSDPKVHLQILSLAPPILR